MNNQIGTVIARPVAAEITKLRTLPLVVVVTILMVLTGLFLPIMLTLVAAQLGEDPARAVSQSVNLLEVGALLLGAGAGGSEYAGRQIATGLLANPHRRRFILAKLAAVTIWLLLSSVIAVFGGAVIVGVFSRFVGVPVTFQSQIGIAVGGVFYLVTLSIIGCCVSLITKSQAATITILLLLFEVVAPMFRQNLEILHWLPNQVGNSLFALDTWYPNPDYAALPLPLLVLSLWGAALIIASNLTFAQRDTN